MAYEQLIYQDTKFRLWLEVAHCDRGVRYSQRSVLDLETEAVFELARFQQLLADRTDLLREQLEREAALRREATPGGARSDG